MRWRRHSLSIRTHIILLTVSSIVFVQAVIFVAGKHLREQLLERVVAEHITTTIRLIRSTVALLPPEHRNTFIQKASEGRWALWTRQLPPVISWQTDQYLQHTPPSNALVDVPSALGPLATLMQQAFPQLYDRPFLDPIHRPPIQLPKPEHTFPGEQTLPKNVQKDLHSLIRYINHSLNDGTRVGMSHSNNVPLMYISLRPEYNPYNNTFIKEWLVIPLDNIEPIDTWLWLLTWLVVSTVLLLGATCYAWIITTPLMRLMHATDQLAHGVHKRVAPAGPHETRVLGERFNDMLSALEQAKTVQQTLLAGLPHDLKAPLARMRLRVEMSDNDTLADGMRKDLQDMQNIVEQFIAYIRDSDPERYRFENIDLTQWLQERIDDWQSLGTDIQLLHCHREPLWVSVDTVAMSRLIDNVVSNAIKYGRPPVHLTLCRHERHQLCLTIDDHGDGIAPERRADALRAFSRLDSARTKTGSVGLGLALVESIVSAHQGRLTLLEAPTGGLRVAVYLPLLKG